MVRYTRSTPGYTDESNHLKQAVYTQLSLVGNFDVILIVPMVFIHLWTLTFALDYVQRYFTCDAKLVLNFDLLDYCIIIVLLLL